MRIQSSTFDAPYSTTRGEVLLVRESGRGPLVASGGGWADVGASPAENAAREVREESGYTVAVERLLAV